MYISYKKNIHLLESINLFEKVEDDVRRNLFEQHFQGININTARRETITTSHFAALLPWALSIDRSHIKAVTREVPLFSIAMGGDFSRRSVKKTGAEVFSDAWRYVVRSAYIFRYTVLL